MSSFPESSYTPNGYIDNPYHTRNLHPSGVIRTSPHIGMGFWFPSGRTDDGDNLGAEYTSNLDIGFRIDDISLVTRADFEAAGIKLTSHYHSKNIFSYDFKCSDVVVSVVYYLQGEHSLTCRVNLLNHSDQAKRISLYASNYLHMIGRKWWGSDGLAGYYVPAQDAVVQTIWAYGHQFALGASVKSGAHAFAKSEADWIEQLESGNVAGEEPLSSRRKEPMYGTFAYDMTVDPGSSQTVVLVLARGINSKTALEELERGLGNAGNTLESRLDEDNKFWSKCPMLTGDWPEHWKHGWVYDIETQRMNSRMPIGIYKHRWDAMLIHEPRVVLGETGIDALTMSYADMPVALEELYGVFADAPYPNVPCTREDGSMNMIAADGSECGTAPSWCFPFHVIHSVYCRTRDREWLAKLYPYLCDFIDWWFENRTDSDGWFHCKCSWESGQDGSKRFLIEGNPGAVSEYVRTVDVEASVVEALANLTKYALELGETGDAHRWSLMAEYRAEKVREMFVDGWYRDFDSRNGKPIILDNYTDIMMLAPVTCGVATQEQIKALEPKFKYFHQNQRFWLEWPSFVFPFSEASWYAGHRKFIAEALFEIGDRVYRRIDIPDPTFNEEEKDRPVYIVPGVSREFWPMDGTMFRGGSENYGWGATMPMNVIRSVFGFREDQDFTKDAFTIAPCIPDVLMEQGRTYGITNLKYRNVTVDIACSVAADGKLSIRIGYISLDRVRLRITDEYGDAVAISDVDTTGEIDLKGPNGSLYNIVISS